MIFSKDWHYDDMFSKGTTIIFCNDCTTMAFFNGGTAIFSNDSTTMSFSTVCTTMMIFSARALR